MHVYIKENCVIETKLKFIEFLLEYTIETVILKVSLRDMVV